MNERNEKGTTGDRPSRGMSARTVTLRPTILAAPVVVDPAAQTWKSYCASRLRHFASGR